MEQEKRHIDVTQTAMTLGLWLGLYQTVKLALIPLSLKYPFFSLLFMAAAIGVPYVAWRLVRNFRDNNTDGLFPFIISWALSIMTFLFATMISALIAYAYLRYLDDGAIVAGLTRQMEEATTMMASAQAGADMEEMLSEMKLFIGQLGTMTPLQATRQLIGVELSWGNIFSLIIAIFTASRTKKAKND